MVLVDLVFHYGGKWIREPKLLYERKLVHKWEGYDADLLSYIDITNEYINILGYVGVQQLLVSVPSGKYYEIEGDEGIRTLLSFVNDKFDVINLFVVDDCELDVDVENIIKMLETVVVIDDVSIDCTSDGTENDSDTSNDNSDYNSEELEVLALEMRRVIDGSLCDYKDLHKSMTFKDISEARRYISLHSLANGYNLTTKKSDRKRLRVVCRDKCNFVCLISGEKHVAGVRVKTLKGDHNKACKDPCGNYKVSATTMAFYFKEKLQANPKYKIKEMRVDMKTAFNINAHFEKCKRAKRMILEDMEGSFCDDYKKIVGYANALKKSNPGTDVVLKVSRNALEDGKRKFSRMYICFDALKSGFKNGLRSFIGPDGTFLKGKAKGQLLSVIGQDSMNHFYPITWAIVDRECKASWVWFLELLQKSLNINSGEGITFMSDMQKGLIEAIRNILPNAMHRFCVRHIEANWRKKARHKPIIGMLEDIRINVMTKFVKNEDELMTWNCDWSPIAIEMYNEFLKIANVCELNFNGDDGFEVSEGNDRHIVNLAAKKCTCRVWDLTGIPCPHSIKALLYKNLDPLDSLVAMEPSELVNLAGRPRVNRKRDKDEALKRQTEWVAPRRGRKITCSNCGILGHNARGCHKFNQNSEEGISNTGQAKSKKKKMDKQCDKGKKQTNERHKTQPTQDCASDEDEDEDFDLDVEDDMPWKPRDFSPKGPTWKGNAPETENMLEQLRKEKMDMRSNKEKKQGNERHRTLIDEEDVEDFPLITPQPTQDEDEDFDIDVEDDMPWKPRDFSELNSRIQQRQNQARPT
ncbi:hypothetical protein MTR67_040148 [Solanum verrucosum]|uniref:SWIM-type domain-containing protein n=1 Tax=Solanum verrucosum TaxID=315347 RepID=A0AAF0UI41_SOLVR|nr:hypothetical protein MTR67_040148 [Solanum verrucosum]